jgi:protein pelota
MRIIESDKKRGSVEVEVEDSDDLWHLYNIIDKGDTVCGSTMREVKVTRGSEEERAGRMRVYLCIEVDDLGFQTFTERLRIKGKVTCGPDEMNIQGSFHSFAVGPRDRITIIKTEWLSFHLERLGRAASKARPKAIVVTIDDQDATIFILRDYQVEEVLTVSSNMPGKYVESVDRVTIKSKYFSSIAEEIQRLLQKEPAEVILAGPGFTKNDLAKHLKEKNRSLKIVEETVSSVGEPGVREVMSRGTLSKIIEDSTIMRDSRLIDELLSRLSKSPSLVSYGMAESERAVAKGAVESLLVSERLLKSISPEERRHIESLCKTAEKYGGKIYFVGGEHEKGKQLANLGGIAALLRFSIGQA